MESDALPTLPPYDQKEKELELETEAGVIQPEIEPVDEQIEHELETESEPEIEAEMVPPDGIDDMGVGEIGSEAYQSEPVLETSSLTQTPPQTELSIAPRHIKSVTPVNIEPPPPPLPTILIPVDDYSTEPEIENLKGPRTFVNPELYNIRPQKLQRPPVGKIVKPKQQEKPEKPKKSSQKRQVPKDQLIKNIKGPKKEPSPDKEQPTDKTSEDDIKKLLEQYKN
jgi:hypothetical protein